LPIIPAIAAEAIVGAILTWGFAKMTGPVWTGAEQAAQAPEVVESSAKRPALVINPAFQPRRATGAINIVIPIPK
jgi:hypothetical protein